MYAMPHSYVWHDKYIWVTWLIHMCGTTHSYVRHDSSICVTRLIHMCDMNHSYVWHDSTPEKSPQEYVLWLLHSCDMTHWPLIFVTWMIHTCAGDVKCELPHSYVWHCVIWHIHIQMHSGGSTIRMCDMIHWYVWHDSFIPVTCDTPSYFYTLGAFQSDELWGGYD